MPHQQKSLGAATKKPAAEDDRVENPHGHIYNVRCGIEDSGDDDSDSDDVSLCAYRLVQAHSGILECFVGAFALL